MPMVKSSRITPISAAAFTSSGSDDEAERVGPDDDAGEQEADDRHEAEAVADVGDRRRRDRPARPTGRGTAARWLSASEHGRSA